MNYFKLIKAFYDRQLISPMSTGQLQLWNVLVYINNQCFWQEWFTVANQTLELLTGLSKSAILKNRNALKQSGLIDFKTSGTKACKYKIIDISTQESNQESVQVSEQFSTHFSKRISKRKVSETVNEKCTQSNTLIDININKDINDDSDSITTTNIYIEKWNSLGISKITAITPKRQALLKTRLKEYGENSFDKCIENIKNSDYLKGKNSKNLAISFDWMIEADNYIKVLENYYANNKSSQTSTRQSKNTTSCKYTTTPTYTGEELENVILSNNDLDDF